MEGEAQPASQEDATPARRGRTLWPARWRWRLSLIALIALILFAAAIWIGRERIAANLIDDALEANGLEASYEIVSIGPQKQVIENLVIGDPDAPNLTAERVIVGIAFSLGAPQIGRIELIEPRLYGSYIDGELSFGALDPVLFAESDEPPGLPELDLAIRDGRGLIETDYGDIGIKLEGAGELDDGFSGILAVTAPGVGTEDCRAEGASVYGDLTSASGRLAFDGPIRLRGFECAGNSLDTADIAADVTLAEDFASLEGDVDLAASAFTREEARLARVEGTSDFAWRFPGEGEEGFGALNLRHALTGTGLASLYGEMARLSLVGTLRTREGGRGEWSTRFEGEGLDTDLGDLAAFEQTATALEGTFLGALMSRFDRALGRALSDGTVSADVTARLAPDSLRVVIPEARIRTADRETVLALSRVSYANGADEEAGRLAGNVLVGGPGLPRINARIERTAEGESVLRMSMAPYRTGSDMLEIPRLEARQGPGGQVRFNGLVRAGGSIPGGAVQGLVVPLEGTYSPNAGLSVGTRCTAVELSSLQVAELSLTRQKLSFCPTGGSAILTYGDELNISARTGDIALSGALADTPMQIDMEAARFAYPGTFALEGLDAMIGPSDNAVRLSAGSLDGSFGDGFAGRFEGGTAGLDAVPLDLSNLDGSWAFEDGALRIDEGSFTLTDRTDPVDVPLPRFEPLIARGATLTLEDNVIRAEASLRDEETATLVTYVAIRHDLASGTGRADLDVPGVRFTENFQPGNLSYLTTGVIADADGTISGEGVIEWDGSDVESSGTFSTRDFDFAAAFGPVEGVSGTIEFTDLLNLTTAPGQELTIASVNPGIEALGGRVVYSLTNGTVIGLEGGSWPFMGGELILRPVTLDYGGGQGQDYIFELVGLDAATFVAQMELDNIGATGTFDGTIPISFDAEGNGSISGGLLISRPPGGNVSYVGELTYEDLGAVANYAFQSLRSLDYNQMSIELNGNLAGEILTQFKIDGVRQGEGASRNFITRQLSSLPIRFNINVRSENFYLLATIVRGLFDPTVFGNPVDQGLLEVENGRFVPREREPPPPVPPDTADETPDAQRRDEPAVQPSESDD